jgi:hypothetical protein
MNTIDKYSVRYWRDVLNKQLISDEDLEQLKSIDISPTKKYLDWLTKIWIKEKPNLNELRTYIEEFFTLTSAHRIEGVDINTFPSFDAFKTFVDGENEKASTSLKELEDDYEVIRDDEDLFIAIPYTHAASRKLGLKYFIAGKNKECNWCTTYATNKHFNNYFYNQGITFYYIKVRSKEMQKQLPGNQHHVAMLVYPNGNVEAYNSDDSLMSKDLTSKDSINKFRKVIGF